MKVKSKIVWILSTGEPLGLSSQQRKLRSMIIADELVSKGYRVVIWANAFDHLSKSWHPREYWQSKTKMGVELRLISGVGYSRNYSLRRFIDHRLVAWKFRWISRKQVEPDLIITSTPPYDLAAQAAAYAKKYKIPFVVDIRDKWPSTFLELCPKTFRPLLSLLLQPEFASAREAINSADTLISISQDLLDWATQLCPNRQNNGKVIPIGFKFEEIDNNIISSHHIIPEEAKGKFIVAFVGTFGHFHNPSIIIEAARKLSSYDNFYFILAGDGELLENLKRAGADLNNIHFPGWLDMSGIDLLLKSSNVGVLPTGSANEKEFFPNKLFLYLAYGLPILSMFEGSVAEMIAKQQIGYNFSTSVELSASLTDLASDRKIYELNKKNARELFETRYKAENLYAEYIEELDNLLQNTRRSPKGKKINELA